MELGARALRCSVLIALASSGSFALAGNWPQLGGPNRDGVIAEADLPDGGMRLEVVWKKPLGSGYSGISVEGGRAVTAYTAGPTDYLGAFDTASGEVIWTVEMDDAFQGKDGSDDGPLSTPLILDGRVFIVTPRGELVAVRLDNGKKLWKTSLVEAFAAPAPDYGFTTSPVAAGGLVVVQVGAADGHGVCAFDPERGEIKWKLGDEAAEYRSPTPIVIDGRTHLVVVTHRTIRGVDPGSGEALWEHSVEEDTFSGMAGIAPAGGGRFLVTGYDESRMFEVVATDEGFALEQRFKTGEIKHFYGAPVYGGGLLFGYSGTYMVAIDAASGERVWKSRPPGKGVPIRVGNHVAVWAKGGALHVAPASQSGFEAVAQADVLDTASLTAPAFADGTFFVRNLEEMAAVAVRRGPPSAALEPPAIPAPTAGTQFGKFLEGLAAVSDKQSIVDQLLAKETHLPLREGETTLHFLYHGEASNVGVAGSMTPHGSHSMHRAAGTDLFFRTYVLEPGSRLEYAYIVDFGDPVADPRNPREAAGSEGKRSEVLLPGWEVSEFANGDFSELRGKMESFEVESQSMGETRTVQVYLPPGYERAKGGLPLVVIPDVLGTSKDGRLPEIVDHLAAAGRATPILVFVPYGPGFAFWVEGYGPLRDAMVGFVADEIVPAVSARYRVRDGRENRAMVGFGWGAFAAMYATIQRSDVFGNAAMISLMTYEPLHEEMQALLEEKSDVSAFDAYVGWGIYDHDPEFYEHIDLRAMNRVTADLLAYEGHRVVTREIPAGTGWGSWWVHVEPVLDGFFGEP